MSISAELDDRVADVLVTDDTLEVRLRDGRKISAPLAWFPRLVGATLAQRALGNISSGPWDSLAGNR